MKIVSISGFSCSRTDSQCHGSTSPFGKMVRVVLGYLGYKSSGHPDMSFDMCARIRPGWLFGYPKTASLSTSCIQVPVYDGFIETMAPSTSTKG